MLNYNEVINAIIKNNGSLSSASKELNIDYGKLHYFVKSNKINFKQFKKTLPSKEEIEKCYSRLGSIKLVAKEFGFNKGNILYAMKKHGIPFKPLARYQCDHDFFSRDNEESFYVAGFIAADGCVKHRKNNSGSTTYEIQICIAEKDKELLYKIKNLFKSNNPIRENISKKDGSKSVAMTIVSAKMAKDLLERFNITRNKSLTYQFPTQIENHPLVNHFMRGYNDGDGSYFYGRLKGNRTVKQVNFSLRGTQEFLTKYREILEKSCNLPKKDFPIRKNCNIGILEYGGNNVTASITNFLYNESTIFLERKWNIAKYAKINSENCASGIKKLNQIGIEKLFKDYSEVKSLTKLSAMYGVSISRIRNYFKSNNLKYNIKEKFTFNENFFEQLNESSSYAIGFLVGSGNIDSAEPRIKFLSYNINILKNLKNTIKYSGNIREQNSKIKKYYFIIYSDKIKKDLINNYSLIVGAGEKTTPKIILNSKYLENYEKGLADSKIKEV